MAFSSTRSGNFEIWACDRDGSNQVQLTFLVDAPAGCERWSPDGRQIAFDAAPEGSWDIFVIRADGGSPRRLTDYSGEDSRPSWSHDGRWIYFNSDRGGTFQIWKVPVEGGEAVPVTRGLGYQALESPDGRYLYFAKGRSDSVVWRAPLASGQLGEEEAVVRDLPFAGLRADWGVADKGVYFAQRKENARSGESWVLKLFESDPGKVKEVMNLPRPPVPCEPLSISPDGKWLLISQADRQGSDLMIVEGFR